MIEQLLGLNLSEFLRHMKEAEKCTFQSMEANDVLPLRDEVNWRTLEMEERTSIRKLCLNAIRVGSVGAVTMRGDGAWDSMGLRACSIWVCLEANASSVFT